MPGRTSAEAIRVYLEPLQRAVSCLPGSGKIVARTTKINKVGDEGAWILNGDEGLPISSLGVLQARQNFRLVETDRSRFGAEVGRFRITTLSYIYGLRLESGASIDWHWHPTGNSDEQRPHMHVHFGGSAHLPCARHTFEDVIESCIELNNGIAACKDWRERLDASRADHVEHRSWTQLPRAALAFMAELWVKRGSGK